MISKFRQRRNTEEFKLMEKYICVNRKHRKILEQRLNSTGVYRSQHQILMVISENPNISQKELARMYGVSGATITVSLKKLEQGGYISREVDSKDNRYNQIRLTEKGKGTVEQSIAIFDELEHHMFLSFSKEDFKKMGELLDRMYRNMEDYSKIKQEREDL